MTDFKRHDVPADIHVFAGHFASQLQVFAHLLEICPSLLMEHIEVIQGKTKPRLLARFDAATVDSILAELDAGASIVLILPAAFDGLDCPVKSTELLHELGAKRGHIPQMVATGEAP